LIKVAPGRAYTQTHLMNGATSVPLKSPATRNRL